MSDQSNLDRSSEYLSDRAGLLNAAVEWQYAPSTLERALVAINAAHAEQNLPLRGHSALVARTLQGIRGDRQRPARQADLLMLSDSRPSYTASP
jgi:hypothetical protein